MSETPHNPGATDPSARPPLGGSAATPAGPHPEGQVPSEPPAGQMPTLGGVGGAASATPAAADAVQASPPLPTQPGPPSAWGAGIGGASAGSASGPVGSSLGPQSGTSTAVGGGAGATALGGSGAGTTPLGGSGAAPKPQQEADDDGVDRRFLVMAAVSLVVVALIALGAALLLQNQQSPQREGAQRTTPTSKQPSTTAPTTQRPDQSGSTEPGATTTDPDSPPIEPGATSTTQPGATTTIADDPQRTAEVNDIVDFVEQSRGLKYKTPPVVTFEDDTAFEAKLLKDFDEEIPDIEKQGVSLRALGLVPADTDLVATTKSMLGAGVVGFYDPESKELYVRGSELTPYVKTVVAHELVHALDDQHFNLDRKEMDKATDETGYAFTVLTEGSAKYVEEAYRDQMSASDQESVFEEENAPPDPRLLAIPEAMIKMIWAPYAQGPELIASQVDSTSMTRVDKAFADPPVSSEQVMTPEKYASDDKPVTVAKPTLPQGAKEVEAGTFGQFMTSLLLADASEFEIVDPNPAVENWAGDQYVSYTDSDDRECIKVDTKMDSASDAAQLESALSDWAAQAPDAQVEASADMVKLTSCVAGGSSGGGAAPF